MGFEFMTKKSRFPSFRISPKALDQVRIGNTARIVYERLLDSAIRRGIEDENGVIFVRYPIIRLAEDISKSAMTVKRALKDLEDRGLIFRIRNKVGEVSDTYVLLPKEEL